MLVDDRTETPASFDSASLIASTALYRLRYISKLYLLSKILLFIMS
jgi:hypothetical protein